MQVAAWPRDRLGSLSPYLGGHMRGRNGALVISAPIDLEGFDAYLDLNVDGLGKYSSVTCAVRCRPASSKAIGCLAKPGVKHRM